jgi:hypothetical protein
MPSVSKSQRKFFGFLKGNPSEAKKRGISGKVVDEYASTKEKGLPNKVSSKKSDMDEDDVCPTCGK